MKKILISGVYSLLLTSCTALSIQYKEGEKVSRMSTDLASCKASALKQLPEDTRIRYRPPVYLNGYPGHYPYYGYSRPERYDANEGKRNIAVNQCMADQDYAMVNIPACTTDVAGTTRIQSTDIMPALTENSCSIRLKSGGWQIVNPG